MKSIAFFNVKGGVGKTSSAINVAHMLAAIHKNKTLLIDLDPQSNATDFYNRYDVGQWSIENVLTGRGRTKEGIETSVSIKDVILQTDYANLDIVPSRLSLGRVEKELVADISTPQQFRLRTQIQFIQDNYDFVILDCSPSAESLVNTNGLALADMVYVPLKCDKWATRGLNATIEVVKTISTYNYNLKFAGCFFVQWENRNINKAIYDTLKEELNDKMLPVKIRKNKSVEEISYACQPLLFYDKKGKATDDYIELTKLIYDDSQ